jgi:hypothetical protein
LKADITSNGRGFRELTQVWPDIVSYLQSQEAVASMDLSHNGSEIFRSLRKYPRGTLLGNILTVNGGGVDAQAATVEDYLKEHFSTAGPILLDALQNMNEHKTSNDKQVQTRELTVTVKRPQELVLRDDRVSASPADSDDSGIIIHARGTPKALLEAAQAFSWLSSAMRLWTCPDTEDLAFSDFQFSLAVRPKSSKISYILDLLPLAPLHSKTRSCWHSLFRKTVITRDAPILDRSVFRKKASTPGM